MKITCNIIRDLLPLYAEDLASEDTRALVDEHLCGCDGCMRQYGQLKKAAEIPIEVETKALKRLGDTIRRRKVLTVCTAILTVITILVSCMGWLLVDIWVDSADAVVFVEPQEDGSIRFLLEDYIHGMTSHGWHQDGYEYELYAHAFQMNRLDYLQSKWDDLTMQETKPNFFTLENTYRAFGDWENPRDIPEDAFEVVPMKECHHWFLDVYHCTLGQKLWGEETGIEPEPRLWGSGLMQKIFWSLVAGFGIALALVLMLRKHHRIREIFLRVSVLTGSGIVSFLFLTSGKFLHMAISDEPEGTLKWVCVITVLLTLTALFWRQLYLLNRQDKAM